jgi:FkbM family methyltransferase
MENKRPDCTIISFEPVPANLRCCKKMIRLFGKGRIHVHEKALSDSSGHLRMVQPTEKGVKMHGLSRVIDIDSQGNETFTVPATCLNNLPELQSPVNWVGLKIDVENFEWHVLRGGVEVIRKFRPFIYCEIWDIPEKERTLQLIREMGYSPFVWEKNKLEPYKAQTALNFYFLPD